MNISIEQINTHLFGIVSSPAVGQVIWSDLSQIKESLALFLLVACILIVFYIIAIKRFTILIVSLTLIFFLLVSLIYSSFCWYTIYTEPDLAYDYIHVARIINNFIKS